MQEPRICVACFRVFLPETEEELECNFCQANKSRKIEAEAEEKATQLLHYFIKYLS